MKNKGFTLVEMLAVLVILGLLIGIGVFTVNNIKDNAEKNYYVSMEDTLKMAGNDYFNDNREDRPIDDYNFVSLETLEDHEYLDVLKTYDKKENCDKSSGVYIYNTDNGNEYEVCLKCGIHKSTGPYCNGKKTGQIMITGRTNTGAYYNPTLSYVGTPWVNASSVNVTFTLMGDDVATDKFEIFNGNTNSSVGECTSISANSCTTNMSVTGSYYVIAYNGSEKVGNRKYFNVKIDNTPPTFDIKDQEVEKDLEDGYEYSYNNEVINIHDDNGYRSAVFSLKEDVTTNPRINIVNQDLTASNLRIIESLPSGKYILTVTVTDYAKNATTKSITFTIKYNVNMVYFDNGETRHDMGTIRVYTNGFYDDLLTQVTINGNTNTVDWYDNTNYDGRKYDTSTKVEKTSTHTLYGREQRAVIPVGDEPHCNNLNNFTYNNNDQELVSAKEGYHLTNNIQKEAGTHTIIAMPDAGFTWADNTRTYKIIQCTIKRYEVEKPVEPCAANLIYNGADQTLIIDKYGGANGKIQAFTPSKDLYTFSPIKGKNAKSYDVSFDLTDKKNLMWNDGTDTAKSYTCSIAKYTITKPTNVCKSGLVYNGYGQQLINQSIIDNNKTSFGFTAYNIEPISGGEAGDYDVSFTLWDVNNYIWSDNTSTAKTYTCKIDKYKTNFDPSSSPCLPDLVYTGILQPLVSLSGGRGSGTSYTHFSPLFDSSSGYGMGDYSISNCQASQAGDYEVVYTLANDNYAWADGSTGDKTYTCTIAKAPITWSTDRTVVYAGYSAIDTAVALSMTSEIGDSIPLRLVPTTVKSPNVYNATVDFASNATDDHKNNYYITNPSTTIGFTNAALTITADSDSKQYDGKALTKNSYKESGTVASNGESISSVKVTGSQTTVGTSDNVPSEAVIKYGGFITTDYYNITYTKGTLEVIRSRTATTGSCNSSATSNGSDKIVTGGSHVDYTNNTTTTSGSNTVTITPKSNYAWSDGTYASKTLSCNVADPCTWDWRYDSTEWDVSSCTASNNGSVKYVCDTYSGKPWTVSVSIKCAGSAFATPTGSGKTYDTKAEAEADCATRGKQICNEDCGGSLNVVTCTCQSASGTSKKKKVKYVYSCE